MHPHTKYLIVIMAPNGKPDTSGAGSYTVATPPQVKWVTAQNAEAALKQVKVAPGGHAFIASEHDIQRFDKAEEAPLERVGVDGRPLPKVRHAEATVAA